MASLAELSVPLDGTEYLDFDALSRALDDWAVKAKFVYRTKRRDAEGATYVCADAGAEAGGCSWMCRGRVVEGEELVVLVVVDGEHRCVGRGVRKFSSSSKKEWLDGTVSRHLNVTKET